MVLNERISIVGSRALAAGFGGLGFHGDPGHSCAILAGARVSTPASGSLLILCSPNIDRYVLPRPIFHAEQRLRTHVDPMTVQVQVHVRSTSLSSQL